jgi:hypothetical protein
MSTRVRVGILLYIIALVAIAVLRAPAQEPPTLKKDVCDHTSNSRARFEHVRVLPPVQIESYDGETLRVKDRFASEMFSADKESVVKLPKDPKGKWFWVMYCDRDRHVYAVVELTDEQRSP